MHLKTTDISSAIPSDCGDRDGRRGTALIFAISMLALFSALGMFYVRYMNLEIDKANNELRMKRARQIAVAGVTSAAADIQQYLKNPTMRPVNFGITYHLNLPTYRSITVGEEGAEADHLGAPRLAESRITIYDESAKVNINHAPASVLQNVLGLSGDVARSIAASVPRDGDSSDKQWYLELRELRARGLISAEDFDEATLAEALTTYTVVNHRQATGHINANKASSKVLAAYLGITEEQVAGVKAKGPFSSADALQRALAEIVGPTVNTSAVDPALGFESRCFRVVCEGRYARFIGPNGEEHYRTASSEEKRKLLWNNAVSRVEAVLLFAPDGSYEIIHWNVDVNVDVDAGENTDAETDSDVEQAVSA